MTLEPTTNFKDSDGVDLGQKLVTKDYLISVYPSIGEQIGIPPELWLWGDNQNGAGGTGSTVTTIATPVTTFSGGTNWKQVSAGDRMRMGIKTDGTLWVWGNNLGGRLGNASTTNVSTPVTTFAGGTDWKQVSGGNFDTAAIKTDGTLWTWGIGNDGRLGNGVTTGNISTPITTFAGETNWKQVSCGGAFTAAIKTDGTLWVWGSNNFPVSVGGQLGTNDTISKSTPVTTFAGGANWKQLSCGYRSVAAIKTDGTLWAWGNNYGSLGNNFNSGRISTPVTTFSGGNNWKQVSFYDTTVIAIKSVDF